MLNVEKHSHAHGLDGQPVVPVGCFQILHQAFLNFNEVLNSETCWEAGRSRLLQLQLEWQSHGLFGQHALKVLVQHRSQICWEGMGQEQFCRFYRFVFHLCREPNKRNMQMEVALSAWRLLLSGRFRLLDRWCDFASRSHFCVVTEDTWRQVLDFSRIIHEDLSNHDPGAAWPVLLDEFVEYVRALHLPARCRSPSIGLDISLESAWSGGLMPPVAPRCGSKRRALDVDLVAEQLHNLPLMTSGADSASPSVSPKRLCTAPPHLAMRPATPGVTSPAGQMGVPMAVACISATTSQRRVVRTRRSGMSDMLKATVCDALGLID